MTLVITFTGTRFVKNVLEYHIFIFIFPPTCMSRDAWCPKCDKHIFSSFPHIYIYIYKSFSLAGSRFFIVCF